jgi:hypothetical protein
MSAKLCRSWPLQLLGPHDYRQPPIRARHRTCSPASFLKATASVPFRGSRREMQNPCRGSNSLIARQVSVFGERMSFILDMRTQTTAFQFATSALTANWKCVTWRYQAQRMPETPKPLLLVPYWTPGNPILTEKPRHLIVSRQACYETFNDRDCRFFFS